MWIKLKDQIGKLRDYMESKNLTYRLVKNGNLYKYNWVQILHNFKFYNVQISLGNEPNTVTDPNSIVQEKSTESKLPLGILDLNFLSDLPKMQALIEERKETLKVQVESQNQKLEELMNNARILFVYTDEEANKEYEKTLQVLKDKGVLFTYLDLSGKTSLKNSIKEKFPEAKWPCVIVENKTLVNQGKYC